MLLRVKAVREFRRKCLVSSPVPISTSSPTPSEAIEEPAFGFENLKKHAKNNRPRGPLTFTIGRVAPRPKNPRNILLAALAYFVLVFTTGFVLGAFRTLLIAPRTGHFVAVLFELPLMLAISWFVCIRVLRRFPVPDGAAAHAAVGAAAFLMLLLAELVLTAAAFGGTPATFAANLLTPHGALGLAGQIAFALFPLLQGRR